VNAFGAWLLGTSAHAAVMIVLVFVVRVGLRDRLTPRWRYALWLLVLARLVLPAVPASPSSIFNLTTRWMSPPPNEAVSPLVIDGRATSQSPLRTTSASTSATLVDTGSRTVGMPAILLGIWAVVAACLLARTLERSRRLAVRIAPLRPVTRPDVLDLLEDCKQCLRVQIPIDVVETDQVASPALHGFFHPRLLLPEGLLPSLDVRRLRLLFLHELAHVKRHDVAVQWLATLAHIVHWFNPAVAIAISCMRRDRELATDSLVLSHTGEAENRAYGETLIGLLEFAAAASRLVPGSVGVLEEKTELKRRVAMIATHRQDAYRPSVLAATVLLVFAAGTLTRSVAETSSAAAVAGSPSSSYDGAAHFPAVTLAAPGDRIWISARSEKSGLTYGADRIEPGIYTLTVPVGTYVIRAELKQPSGKSMIAPVLTDRVRLDHGQVAREVSLDSVRTDLRTTRVFLLDENAETTNRPDKRAELTQGLQLEASTLDDLLVAVPVYVRLESVQQTGTTLLIKGVTTSLPAIVDFMTKLQRSAWFTSVELRSTAEQNAGIAFDLAVTVLHPSTATR
jgi:beta-lactamase regulating signal transducer with metallopeptidase domain